MHLAWSFVIPKSAKREKTPRNAPERAEHAAPEARDEAVREEDRDEQEDDEPGLVKVELLALPDGLREQVLRVIGGALHRARVHVLRARRGARCDRYCTAGDDPEADRSHRDADRVEEAADRAPGDAGDEERVEQVVLHALVGVRLVGLDARCRRAPACSAGATRRSGGACRTGRSIRRRRGRRPS